MKLSFSPINTNSSIRSNMNEQRFINYLLSLKIIMRTTLFLVLLSALFISCNTEMEEEIHWDVDTMPNMLVVESVITNEFKFQSVRLTLSRPYFDRTKPATVSDAIVNITEGSNVYSFIESSENPGMYYSETEFSGEPFKTYTLNINLSNKINGLFDYSAVSTMPEGIDIDYADFYIYEMPEIELYEDDDEEEKDTTILGVYFFGNEPIGNENYYINKVFRNDKLLQESAKEYTIYTDDYRNGEYSHLSTFINNIVDGDEITFQVLSIEKGFYKFLEGVINSEQSGGMGSITGPPANAVGNIQNGKGLGYFGAAYISEVTGYAVDKR